MANWNYDPSQYDPTANSFEPIPEGDHRVRIRTAEEFTSQSGNEGFKITLDVSGHSGSLWYYLMLDASDPKKTNQRIGKFLDSFSITNTNLNAYSTWVGKVGAVRVKHEDYNGNTSSKVAFLLSSKDKDSLPPWKEPGSGAAKPAPAVFTPPDDDLELPF